VLDGISELLILLVLGDQKKKQIQNQRIAGFHERTIKNKPALLVKQDNLFQ
jgi:hypothetical protein